MKRLFGLRRRALIFTTFLICQISSAVSNEEKANTLGGEQAFKLNQLDRALAHFKDTLDTNKNLSSYYISKIHLIKGNLDTAEQYIQDALEISPNSADEYLLLGNIHGVKAQQASVFSKFGHAKKCLKNYELANKQDPNHEEALSALIDYHTYAPGIAGGSKKKRQQYLDMLSKNNTQLAKLKEISILSHEGKIETANELATALQKSGNLRVDTSYPLAKYFKNQAAYPEAKTLLEQILDVQVTNETKRLDRWAITDAKLQLAEVLLLTKQDFDRGISLIEQYHQIMTDPADMHYYWSFWSLAKLHQAKGNEGEYLELVEKIKAMDYQSNKYFAKEFDNTTR